MSRKVLIFDDEASLLEFLSLLFEEEGYEVESADSVAGARERLAESPEYDLVLCDILMPDGDGLDLLREIKTERPHAAVIMMTAYASTDSAIEAMKLGAYDYISKPFDVEELKVMAEKAIERTDLEQQNVYLQKELAERHSFANIIGSSRAMQEIFRLVERVARTSSTVLVHGESGTGKELIARAIHFASPRSKAKFLSINCGALPENLLESELFGHVKGAFTGAVRDKRGLFQEADRGTVFLDEIGEMSPTVQVKVLRALQEKTVRRVGGNAEEQIDVRIIAATNQDLEARIAEGDFREDLYYRINVIPIHLPSLRRRREDIPLLTGHFLQKFSDQLGVERKRISVDAMKLLERYSWPGNVRELENIVERAVALTADETITTRDLPAQLTGDPGVSGDAVALPEEGLDLEEHLEGIRADLMRQALDRTGGVQTRAAELLGMSFRSFRYYAKKVGVTGSGDAG